jgi:hypothetical protein
MFWTSITFTLFKSILLEYSLTHSWSWALLEKLPIVQILKNFPAFYGTRKFNTVFTRALHCSLSWTTSIQSIKFHPNFLRSILILSTHLRLGLPSCLFPSGFPTNILYAFLSYEAPHYVVFSTSRHFISLRSKYSPQHPILKHPQSMFLP